MLAGCSSALLSPRHQLRSEASVQLQEKHCPLHQKMGTQRFDLPCGFSRKDAPRVSISLEKPAAETRGNSCNFRQNPVTPSSSSSLVALAPPWGGRINITEGGGGMGNWEQRRRSLKRFHERSTSEEFQAKRTRTGDIVQFVDSEQSTWFPLFNIEETPVVKEEEDEEKVFLVPNAASFPLWTSSSDTLVGTFSTENDLGTAGPGGTNDKSQSDSSSSSAAHSSSPEQNKDSSENATLHRPRNHNPSGIAEVGGEGEDTPTEQQGLELLSLLTSCAESISSGNYEAINFLLARLGELASHTGSSIHRLVAYFTEALAIKVVKLWPHAFSVSPPKSIVDPSEDDEEIVWRVLNYTSPIPKFVHFTLNERLLRAFEGKDRVHIIDFDIKQGLQWPSLFQSLASRPNPPSHVRITGIGESRQDLQETGVRLLRLAEAMNLPFEFHPVVDRLEDVRLWMLHVKREECVAVNCVLMMHRALYEENAGALMDLLGLIRSTNPAIVLMAEQEAKHNDPSWETRLANSLGYYGAIFDSIDISLPKASSMRIKVEEMFAREIRNIVSCEGRERIERHEKFYRWRKLMEDGGFRIAGVGERETLQSRMILRMYSCDSYSIETQGDGQDGLTLKWLDQPLYTVSAWAPIDVAGSSTTSQPS